MKIIMVMMIIIMIDDHDDHDDHEDLLKNMGKDSISRLGRKYWVLEQDEKSSNLIKLYRFIHLIS